MKRLAIVLASALLLIGCYSHINRVKDKWGPPAKVEYQQNKIIHYYYFYQDRTRGYIPAKGGLFLLTGRAGWYVVEIITDRDGKILSKRKYWKQPDIK